MYSSEESKFKSAKLMELIQAISERRSMRAFKPELVPKGTLEEILGLTINAPSANNL
jgi:nitroreductase